MEKCKLRAKCWVYWPGITERVVVSCKVCQKYQNSQKKEPIIPSEIPSSPLQTISADLFYAQQSWFLIVVFTIPSSSLLENFTASQLEQFLMQQRFCSPKMESPIHFSWVPTIIQAYPANMASKPWRHHLTTLLLQQAHQGPPELYKEQDVFVKDPVRQTWNPVKVLDQGGYCGNWNRCTTAKE